MADQLLTFRAANGEDVFPFALGMGHEIVEAIGDKKFVFVAQGVSLVFSASTTGASRHFRARHWLWL